MKRENLILDLDATIIHSVSPRDLPSNWKMRKLKWIVMPSSDRKRVDYVVFLRPHLELFLTYIFKYFNVSVWTAASHDYALFIINNVILRDRPERKLDIILYDYHGQVSQHLHRGPKQLKILWNEFLIPNRIYNEYNTRILDDNAHVKNPQKNLVITAPEFDFFKKNPEQDKFLLNLVYTMKQNSNSIIGLEHI